MITAHLGLFGLSFTVGIVICAIMYKIFDMKFRNNVYDTFIGTLGVFYLIDIFFKSSAQTNSPSNLGLAAGFAFVVYVINK